MDSHEVQDHAGLPGEGRSFWIDSTPATDYPTLKGELQADVAVVGGGIVGITTALLLREAGYSVALLEAERLVRGVTGHTTAQVSALHDLIYDHLISQFGRERARQYADANQSAIDRIERLVAGHRIDCDFSRLPFYAYAESDQTLKRVQREVEAAQELSLPASFADSVPLPFATKGAVRCDRQAQFHPRRYLLALAAAIPDGRSAVFEKTRVTKIEEGEPCTVTAQTGAVRAREVVVATHYPVLAESGFYFARLHPYRHYALALASDWKFPRALFVSAEEDGLAWRSTPFEGGELIIVDDGQHTVGEGGDTRQHYRRIAGQVTSVLPDARIRYHWSAQDYTAVDRVPYIGRLSAGSRHLYTATGFRAWGMTTGTAAAMILTDLIRGGESPWTPVFDPQRFKPLASAGELLKQAGTVARAFVGARIGVPREELSAVGRGEGKVIAVDGQKVGVFRDPDGRLHGVNPTCTHMACIVSFNDAEKTWDCPCHGSRYSVDGEVLHAPAIEGLPRIDLEGEAPASGRRVRSRKSEGKK
jgi:glycine/D-amino acid oxidase-like deaminating enzyme/nitrite reductase/ring-hydroxylating ferredoxin subunit